MPSPRPRPHHVPARGVPGRLPAAGAPEIVNGTVPGRISTTDAAARKADSDPPGRRRAAARSRPLPGV